MTKTVRHANSFAGNEFQKGIPVAFNRKGLLAIACSAVLMSTGTATLPWFSSQLLAAEAEVALNGMDLVSYFEGDGKPVPGLPAFAAFHNGQSYLFSNQKNADAFAATPDAYLPQYGGHCAWAAAQGSIAPGDPAYYRVVNGKLYLNYNAEVQTRWVSDIVGFIAKADSNWPQLKANAQ